MKPIKILNITTVPETLHSFFKGQSSFLKGMNINSFAISSPGILLEKYSSNERVPFVKISMQRSITPLRDVISIFKIVKVLKILKPNILHAHTPKGGLLGVISSRLARVPTTIYTIHGLPYTGAVGYKRKLLWLTEYVSCRFSNQVFAVSESMRTIAIRDGLISRDKISILSNGTANGIQAESIFNPTLFSIENRRNLKVKLNIPQDAQLVGFVGRMVVEKGITELIVAWLQLREKHKNWHLLLVGPEENHIPLNLEIKNIILSDSRIHWTGFQENVAELYSIMDILALPSYREGFPYVPMEAAAMEVPVVTTDIPGCTDAVVNNCTGVLVRLKNSNDLMLAIDMYMENQHLRILHGRAGRNRILKYYLPNKIWICLAHNYIRIHAMRLRTRNFGK